MSVSAAALILSLLPLSPAFASDAHKENCIRGPLGCKIGVEDLECGSGSGNTGWHCKSTWKNDCLCFDYGTSKSGWWFALVSDWQSNPSGPLLPNTVTTVQLVPMADDVFGVWDLADDVLDAGSAEMHTGSSDMVGQFALRLLSGPPNAIPARIEFLQMNIVSFNVEGVPTGPNTISLSSPSPVLGIYDSLQHVLDFNEPIQCVLYNHRFPAGQPIDLRPRAIAGNGGGLRLNLSATLWVAAPSDVSDPDVAYDAITVSPNPATHGGHILFTLPLATTVRLEVFDAGGRLVRALADGPRAQGLQSVEWDGRYASGRTAPPGIYFVQLTPGSGLARRARLTVVR